MITTSTITIDNASFYVAFDGGLEVARVRIPSHLVFIEDDSRRTFLFSQVASNLAEKLSKLGYGSKDMTNPDISSS